MDQSVIAAEIVKYLEDTNPIAKERSPLPMDESLYNFGVLDSFGIIELVDFIERRWSIKILDSEITKEKFGGINKMTVLINEKLKR
jgi:acyl carrier protein